MRFPRHLAHHRACLGDPAKAPVPTGRSGRRTNRRSEQTVGQSAAVSRAMVLSSRDTLSRPVCNSSENDRESPSLPSQPANSAGELAPSSPTPSIHDCKQYHCHSSSRPSHTKQFAAKTRAARNELRIVKKNVSAAPIWLLFPNVWKIRFRTTKNPDVGGDFFRDRTVRTSRACGRTVILQRFGVCRSWVVVARRLPKNIHSNTARGAKRILNRNLWINSRPLASPNTLHDRSVDMRAWGAIQGRMLGGNHNFTLVPGQPASDTPPDSPNRSRSFNAGSIARGAEGGKERQSAIT